METKNQGDRRRGREERWENQRKSFENDFTQQAHRIGLGRQPIRSSSHRASASLYLEYRTVCKVKSEASGSC